MPKFHLARHVMPQNDLTPRTCQGRRDERITLCSLQHGRRRTSNSARLYKCSRLCSYIHKSCLSRQRK